MDGKRYILGYWFADQENEIKVSVEKAGWRTYIKEDDEISEIYKCIKTAQEKENWKNRSRLPFTSIFKKPFKDWSVGWYVLRSNNHFPCILSCLQKNVILFGSNIYMFAKPKMI